ncbi:MAG: hypothetical protein FWC51_02880 [Proteobacteria bacterium]|nr:hypothetical protein [Pseudomonadota bacterium]
MCPANTYSAGGNVTSCRACPAGYTSPAGAAACAAGLAKPATGITAGYTM